MDLSSVVFNKPSKPWRKTYAGWTRILIRSKRGCKVRRLTCCNGSALGRVPVMCNLQTFVECEYFQSGDGPAWHPLKMPLAPSIHFTLSFSWRPAASHFPQGVAATTCSIIGVTPKCTPRWGGSLLWRSKVPDSSYIVYWSPVVSTPPAPHVSVIHTLLRQSPGKALNSEDWTWGADWTMNPPSPPHLSPACCLPRGWPVRPHHEASLSSSFGWSPRRADQSWGWGESRWESLQVASGWPPAEGLSSREAALFPASLLHLCAGEMLAPLNSAGGSGSLAFVSPVWTHGFHTACSDSCLKTKPPQTPSVEPSWDNPN